MRVSSALPVTSFPAVAGCDPSMRTIARAGALARGRKHRAGPRTAATARRSDTAAMNRRAGSHRMR